MALLDQHFDRALPEEAQTVRGNACSPGCGVSKPDWVRSMMNPAPITMPTPLPWQH